MHSRFNTLVDNLVSYNKDMRENLPFDTYRQLSDIDFVTEFCTIRCNVGSRVGKSLYIDNRAGINDLVIVPNTYTERNGLATVMTASEVNRLPISYRGISTKPKFVNIYVDEPTLCEKYLSMEALYSILTCSKLQTFILLGA